ncbi:MAG: hypothetical protein ACKV22_11610 [Bryobacteraceae bacterium]
MITGTGGFQYEVIHDWAQTPDSLQFGNTHGVVEDSQGLIYVFHTVHATSSSADAMAVFDPGGRFVKSWGGEFRGGAHGLHLAREGSDEFLYLTDYSNAVVVKTTLDGKELFRIGYPRQSDRYQDGRKYSPTNLALAPNGDLYIADGYGSSFVLQYDRNGNFVRTIGDAPGSEPGQLNCPHGITVDARGAEPLLLIADRTNNRLQYFTLDGKFVRIAGGVLRPCHFDQRDGVLLIPDLASRVTLLDQQNEVITHLCEDTSGTYSDLRKQPREKFIPGKFICPHGACFDHEGNIFVVEWVEIGRVTKLKRIR